MKIFDISRTLRDDLAPWPGDRPFRFTRTGSIAEGLSVNIGAISMSLHNGTHGDAKFHFDSEGWTMEQADLAIYLGPAVVVDLSERYRSGALPKIEISDLSLGFEAAEAPPRLLLKTNIWRDSTVFPKAIPTIAADVPGWLQERGVKLLGLDLPSVDEVESKTLRNHHALGAAGISIVESLDLSAVEAGRYNFVGLPLKVAGGDGSPLRAILWRE